jgi:hypothetical protein
MWREGLVSGVMLLRGIREILSGSRMVVIEVPCDFTESSMIFDAQKRSNSPSAVAQSGRSSSHSVATPPMLKK